MRTEKSKAGLRALIDEIENRANHGLCKHPKDMNLLEVGAFSGDGTLIFCEYFKTVTCVDPWENNRGDITDSVDMQAVFELWIKRTSRLSHPPTWKRHSFKEFFLCFYPERLFDVIYIDALHGYDSIKQDIEMAKKIVTDHGIIAGHDYSRRFAGVMQAVDEEFSRPDVVTSDSSWLKILEG